MRDFWHSFWPVLFWLGLGLPLVVLASRLAASALGRLGREHAAMVVRRLIFYLGIVAIVASVLLALEVDLTGVLATAGVATIAIGFAAQASLSNYISGLFLMGERSFRVGDLIRVGASTGVVESIDLLSVKLRTLDNLYVRIPNEEMLKSQVTNVTRYPIRRMDLLLRTGHDAPLEEVRRQLRAVAEANPHTLAEPEPLILIEELGEAGFQLRFGVWFEKARFVEVRNSLFEGIQSHFREAGIHFEIPRVVVEESRPRAT
ncbi:MAG: mechanosensitive ion channel family protein [Verrucomicrobiota bacterium]